MLRPIEKVVEDYVSSLDYFVTEDITKAGVFISATLELIARRPESTTVAGNVVKFDHDTLQEQLREARKWFANKKMATSNATGVRYYDMSRQRG